MNKKQFEEDWYKNLIGKTVFFMSEDKITKGVITKGEPYQLFVGKPTVYQIGRISFSQSRN